jgi:hypothetical protein
MFLFNAGLESKKFLAFAACWQTGAASRIKSAGTDAPSIPVDPHGA